MLENLKLLLGLASDDTTLDDLLNFYIDTATQDANNRFGIADVNPISTVIVRMAEYLYNTRGTRGLDKESYSGASYSYLDDYPDDLLAALAEYAKTMENGRGWLKTI
jgi:hypothetical protein